MVLIKPKPEFVIRAGSSKKEKMDFCHKVYINMCSCKDFKPPQSEKIEGRNGYSWSLLYFFHKKINKNRHEQTILLNGSVE